MYARILPLLEFVFAVFFTVLFYLMVSSGQHYWWGLAGMVFFGICSLALGYAVVSGLTTLHTGLPDIVATIDDDSVVFKTYPYRHTSVYKRNASIHYSDIACAFSSFSDPAMVLQSGEILFLPEDLKTRFSKFCTLHGIAMPALTENWAIIAEPFLDTAYEESDRERDYRTLEAAGFSRAEVKALRRKISGPMTTMTFITWEWGGYSTREVLDAFAVLAPLRFTRNFYQRFMEVALRNYPAHVYRNKRESE